LTLKECGHGVLAFGTGKDRAVFRAGADCHARSKEQIFTGPAGSSLFAHLALFRLNRAGQSEPGFAVFGTIHHAGGGADPHFALFGAAAAAADAGLFKQTAAALLQLDQIVVPAGSHRGQIFFPIQLIGGALAAPAFQVKYAAFDIILLFPELDDLRLARFRTCRLSSHTDCCDDATCQHH
jgi:hypothetical protein